MQSFPSDMLNSIRSFLEAEKKRISARIQELTAQDPYSNPDRLSDNAASDTEANEESSHDRFSALITELNRELVQLDKTLARIARGTYGYCENCGSMIDTDRLSIIPTATLCLTCERKKRK